MPTLPTFTVTDAQAQRLLAAFGSQAKYEDWLKEQIVNFVVQFELGAMRTKWAADLEAALTAKQQEIIASLIS